MRRSVLTALIFLIVAAPGHAAPRALTRMDGSAAIAPAGEQVLVARTQGSRLRVFAYPVIGGAARHVFSFKTPKGLQLESAGLAASAQRAALRITMIKSRRDAIGAVQAFSGPVAGGWSELRPLSGLRPLHSGFDFAVGVDGERGFTVEPRGEGDDPGLVVRDPDPHEVVFATGEEAASAIFAGDFAAVRSRAADESVDDRDPGDVVVVRNWRTGAVIGSADLQADIGSIALHPDGRVAAITTDGTLYEVRPGEPPRLLTRRAGTMAYAGDAIVYSAGDGLRVIDPSGRIRRFGAPTATLSTFATDASRVAWEANGCLLVDDVNAQPATAPGPGPCPRSELAIPTQADPELARTVSVVLRCVAAPRSCRGALRLNTADRAATSIGRRVRFSIPAGHARRVRVRLTNHGYAFLTRHGTATFNARTDDGERAAYSFRTLEAPSLEPPPGSSPRVRSIYTDYRNDGVIDMCAHSLRAFKQALATIPPDIDRDFPDFRQGIEEAIRRHSSCGTA